MLGVQLTWMLFAPPAPLTDEGAARNPRSRVWTNSSPERSETRSWSCALALVGTITSASPAFSSPGLMVPHDAVLSVTVDSPSSLRSLAVTWRAGPVPRFLSFTI